MARKRPDDLDEPHGGLPRNFRQPCILLLLKEGNAHGYDLMDRLSDFNIARTDPGGLYRTLRSLERDGLVESWWETSTAGPARRTYALTDDGEDWLRAWAGTLREVRRVLEHFLTRYATVTEELVADED